MKSGSHYGTHGDGEIMVAVEVPHTRRPADDYLRGLEESLWALDLDPGWRAELLDGHIVVSPPPVLWHSEVVFWLYEQFRDASRMNGWGQSQASALVLPRTRDILEPDHLVFTDRRNVSNLKYEIPVERTLLVSEVVSPSSVKDDREVKLLRYAAAGIPFYLLVDRFRRPTTVTLFSGPGENGYDKAVVVPAADGAMLHIPEPCDVTLDLATLPETDD
jgi:Uma2 family endonuclease